MLCIPFSQEWQGSGKVSFGNGGDKTLGSKAARLEDDEKKN